MAGLDAHVLSHVLQHTCAILRIDLWFSVEIR